MPSKRKQDDFDALKQFGITIKKLRTKAGISQESLGILVGLHRTTIGELERGEQNVSLISLRRIAGALGVDIAQLVEKVYPSTVSPDDIKEHLASEVDKILSESRIKYKSVPKGSLT